MSVEVGDFFKG